MYFSWAIAFSRRPLLTVAAFWVILSAVHQTACHDDLLLGARATRRRARVCRAISTYTHAQFTSTRTRTHTVNSVTSSTQELRTSSTQDRLAWFGDLRKRSGARFRIRRRGPSRLSAPSSSARWSFAAFHAPSHPPIPLKLRCVEWRELLIRVESRDSPNPRGFGERDSPRLGVGTTTSFGRLLACNSFRKRS